MAKLSAYSLFCFLVSCALSCQQDRSPEAKGYKTPADSAAQADSAGGQVSQGKPRPVKSIDEMDKSERDAYKAELERAKYYSCCIKPTCTMCLYDAEECACATAVKKSDPVCGECYRGWQKGKGSVEGVNAKKVKRM